MSNTPLLSVVIATKNREKYCIETIKSILNLKTNEIEITIADNSESMLVKEYVEGLDDNRILYKYDGSAISSIDNFNKAMELATGEYVCLLGDDDGLLPDALATLRWANENNIDSICSNRAVIYYWPEAIDKYPEGFLEVPIFNKKKSEINTTKELDKLLRLGIQNYLLYPLPKSYHGFVKRQLMQKIKETTGHFYGGLSPDIYSAVALSLITKKHYVIDKPLTIAGVCKTSTTADNFTGKHSGSLEGIPHLRNREGYEWSDLVPRYYSTNTIWAESGVKAIEEMKCFNLLSRFNIYYMTAQGIINNYKFIPKILRQETINFRKNRKISPLVFFIKIVINLKIIVFKKILVLINKKKQKNSFVRSGVSDIHECIELSSNFINH